MSVQPASRQRGYSLTELLVVVAIVGAISLVTVPNFMSMMKASKFKSSLQTFANDIRSTRQRAITQYKRMKIGYDEGSRAYTVFEHTGEDVDGDDIWTRVGNVHYLEENTYFADPSTIIDRPDDNDDLKDLVFTKTGALELHADQATPYQIYLRTDSRIPKDQYLLDFKLAGGFTTTGSTWH